MSAGVVVTRTNNTRIHAEVPRFGNRWKVEHILWMARLLTEAVDAGMPTSTEVKILESSMRADHVIVQEIP